MADNLKELNSLQREVILEIVRAGNELGVNNDVITAGIVVANAESSLGLNLVNPTSSARGVFQYLSRPEVEGDSWETAYARFADSYPGHALLESTPEELRGNREAEIKFALNEFNGYYTGYPNVIHPAWQDEVDELKGYNGHDPSTNFNEYAYLRHNTSVEQTKVIYDNDLAYSPEAQVLANDLREIAQLRLDDPLVTLTPSKSVLPEDLDNIEPESGEFEEPLPESKPKPSTVDEIEEQVEASKNEASPLVLDLDGDGIDLGSLDSDGSVYWDIDQDGMAEASGWVAPDDGLLALDRNNDGMINNHSELFGTESEDGFVMLSALDSNDDSIINENDTDFRNLLVWQDVNSDGVSQNDELFSLTDLDIASIDLNYTETDDTVSGNSIRSESTFTLTDSSVHKIVDAWFSYDNVNTVFAGDYTLDAHVFFLPTARGYGDLPDLHIAAVNDNDLFVLLNCA